MKWTKPSSVSIAPGVADDPGGHDHPDLRVLGRRTAAIWLATASRRRLVEDLVEAVEDDHGRAAAGQVVEQRRLLQAQPVGGRPVVEVVDERVAPALGGQRGVRAQLDEQRQVLGQRGEPVVDRCARLWRASARCSGPPSTCPSPGRRAARSRGCPARRPRRTGGAAASRGTPGGSAPAPRRRPRPARPRSRGGPRPASAATTHGAARPAAVPPGRTVRCRPS